MQEIARERGWVIPLGPWQELAYVLVLTATMHAVRMVVSAMGLRLADVYGVRKERQRRKVASNAWYATYYLCAALTGAWILHNSGWWAMGNICVVSSAPSDCARFPILYHYFCVQVAFYINYIMAMATGIDVRRKDFWAFSAHHVITMGLIIYARNSNHLRTGVAVFAIHDAADPLLHFAKMLKYTGAPELHSDIVFVLFMVIFFATRWFLLPWWVISHCTSHWISSGDLVHVGTAINSLNSTHVVVSGYPISFYGMSVILLYCLMALHLFWGVYIMRMAWRKLVEGESEEDINSDEEKEDDDDDAEVQGLSERECSLKNGVAKKTNELKKNE